MPPKDFTRKPASKPSVTQRLNQFLARHGDLSRRKADEAIEAGRVKLNGRVAQLGQSVDPLRDVVTLDGKRLNAAQIEVKSKVIAFHKPKGVLTTKHDPQGRKTIYDVLPKEFHQLKPVGRLDRNSSGLLILTDDGELLNRLTHPKYQHTKYYRVTVDKPLEEKDLLTLEKGIPFEPEGQIALAKVTGWLEPNKVELSLKTGMNRQVRRMFEALGYKVTLLKRTAIGQFMLAQLAPGKVKVLNKKEQRLLLN